MKKKRLELTDHQRIGADLKEIYSKLIDLSCLIPNTYGITSRVGKSADKAYKAILNLRCVMEDQFYADCGRNATLDVYYGEQKETPAR